MPDVDRVGRVGGPDQLALLRLLERQRFDQFGQTAQVDGFGHGDQVDDVAHLLGDRADLVFHQLDQRRRHLRGGAAGRPSTTS